MCAFLCSDVIFVFLCILLHSKIISVARPFLQNNYKVISLTKLFSKKGKLYSYQFECFFVFLKTNKKILMVQLVVSLKTNIPSGHYFWEICVNQILHHVQSMCLINPVCVNLPKGLVCIV